MIRLLALLCFCLTSALAEAPAKPNVILIISDDQGHMDYGFMGSKQAKTPNIDKLASEGLLYTRGYTMPVCSPSLACLLTGKYPHAHGITGNDLANAPKRSTRSPLATRLLNNSLTLPKAITEAGYLTYQTGKLWNTTFGEVGFTAGMTDTAGRHGDAGLKIGRNGMEPVLSFMDGAREQKKPFFIWYAPMMPHDPHTPPARLLEKYAGKGPTPAAEKYFAMVEWFDETCGVLAEYLKKHDLDQNTVILYLADNGWDAANGMPGKRAKLSPYELGIRTPMFVRWPGKVQPLRDDETLASVVDFAPTILKITGATIPKDMAGLDLLDRAAMTARKSVFVEAYTHDIADLAQPARSLNARIVINGWSKLMLPGEAAPRMERAMTPTETSLFDLKSDPKESANLAPTKTEEVTRLTEILDAWWKP